MKKPKVGDRVKLIDGPGHGVKGEVVRIDDRIIERYGVDQKDCYHHVVRRSEPGDYWTCDSCAACVKVVH